MGYVASIKAVIFQIADYVLSTEAITQLLHLQSVFQMIDNNISNWIHVYRVMTGRPLRQVNFASIKRFRAQRIALEEIGNHGYVTLRGEVVCHKLDVLVDRTKDIAEYEDCVAIRTSGMSEICWYVFDIFDGPVWSSVMLNSCSAALSG